VKKKKTKRAHSAAATRRYRWKAKFLETLRTTGIVGEACAAVGIARVTAYAQRKADAKFAAAWTDALDDAVDLLEAEARRRAVDGCPKLKFHEGAVVMVPDPNQPADLTSSDQLRMIPYVEHEYSDGLLTLLLKSHRPEKYRDNHKVTINGQLNHRTGAEGEAAADSILAELQKSLGIVAEAPAAGPGAD
jgi:hypothetical protein